MTEQAEPKRRPSPRRLVIDIPAEWIPTSHPDVCMKFSKCGGKGTKKGRGKGKGR